MTGTIFDLSGRVALITGAGRGIGLGIAQGFVEAGAAVAIQDIELDVARAEVEKLTQAGAKAIALGGDIGDLEAVRGLIPEVVKQLGGLDILVNNASIQSIDNWMELSVEQIDKTLRPDLVVPILLCQEAARIFIAKKWGRIINLGSIQQGAGNPRMLPYSLAKAALAKLTMALSRELAPHGVTVNQIAPGYVDTHRNRVFFNVPGKKEAAAKDVPVGRVSVPRDYAGIAILLASEAGSYITGQTIYVDGGLSARSVWG